MIPFIFQIKNVFIVGSTGILNLTGLTFLSI